MKKEITEIKRETSMQNIKQNKVNYMKKKNRLKKGKKTVTLSGVELMTTRFQKLHITSRLISAYLLQCSQIPINTLFCQFNSLFANTETYEANNKLRNYRIIYANFIHEYGVNFHELYLPYSPPASMLSIETSIGVLLLTQLAAMSLLLPTST